MKRLVALNAQYMHVNLSLRQIMRTLTPRADCEMFESNINVPYHQLLEQIARGGPSAIGFSVYIWNADLVWRLVRALRRALPDACLFVGGPEVSGEGERVLREHPSLDCVLSGEGEMNMAAFLRAVDACDFGPVPGLSYRRRGEVCSNPMPPALPAEDFVDVWADGLGELKARILYVETSRGCPYRCGYCLSGGAGAVRALPADESIRRLTKMAEDGAKLIKLVDRTFNFDRARANQIWLGLIEHSRRTGLLPRYHFEIGAHLLDDAAFDVLGQAPPGLFQFEAGIQSSDEDVLRTVGRGVSFAELTYPLARIVQLGTIHLHVDLIAGLPGEDPATFARSFDDAFRVGAEQLQLGFLKLLHGSALRRDAERHGIVFEPDPPYEVLSTRAMSFSALCHLKDVERVLEWYHNSGRYRRTLSWLLQDNSPYRFFSALAERFRAQGAFDRDQGEKARATMLLGACDAPPIRALMTHDLLLAGRRRDLPDALAFEEDDELRAMLRARFHPVRGQSACRYRYDVEAYQMDGRLSPGDTIVIYT